LLAQDTGIKVTHVPYRGTPALVTALLAGQADHGVELVHAVQGQVQAGTLKLLAVGSPERWPTIPDVPTVAEQGVAGYSVTGWYGWVYPAGTPQPIVDKTYAALKEVLGRPANASSSPRPAPWSISKGQPNSRSFLPTMSLNGKRCATEPGLNRTSRMALSVDYQRG